jgi:microcystin-dependent protein
MARDRIPIVVLGNDGRPLAGANVTVRNHPAGTTATVYADDASGATIANPLVSDARGGVAGWVDRGMYAATITAGGFGPIVEYFSAAPAGLKGIDAPWLGDDTLAAITAALLPIGVRIGYAGAGDPAPITGGPTWMLCDGRALVRATFVPLFAAIGTTYGAGDGASTFNLPDHRGRAPLGAINPGTGAGPNANDRAQLARGAAGGEVLHALSVAELAAHAHPLRWSGRYAAAVSGSTFPGAPQGGASAGFTGTEPGASGAAIDNAGGGGGHNNLGPYIVENALIRVA